MPKGTTCQCYFTMKASACRCYTSLEARIIRGSRLLMLWLWLNNTTCNNRHSFGWCCIGAAPFLFRVPDLRPLFCGMLMLLIIVIGKFGTHFCSLNHARNYFRRSILRPMYASTNYMLTNSHTLVTRHLAAFRIYHQYVRVLGWGWTPGTIQGV